MVVLVIVLAVMATHQPKIVRTLISNAYNFQLRIHEISNIIMSILCILAVLNPS